jgi:hypothetical protein
LQPISPRPSFLFIFSGNINWSSAFSRTSFRRPLASVVVIHFTDLERHKNSRMGTYLAWYMTPAAQASRLIGDLVMVFAAWFHSVIGIATGLFIIVVA